MAYFPWNWVSSLPPSGCTRDIRFIRLPYFYNGASTAKIWKALVYFKMNTDTPKRWIGVAIFWTLFLQQNASMRKTRNQPELGPAQYPVPIHRVWHRAWLLFWAGGKLFFWGFLACRWSSTPYFLGKESVYLWKVFKKAESLHSLTAARTSFQKSIILWTSVN